MFQMNIVSRANAAVYVVIALAILCVHLSVAHPKHTSGGQQQCVESIIPGPRDNNQILCEVSKDVYYACEKSNCNSGGSPGEDASVHPFSKMTWDQCALAPGTTRDKKVTGTLTYMVDHKYGIMGTLCLTLNHSSIINLRPVVQHLIYMLSLQASEGPKTASLRTTTTSALRAQTPRDLTAPAVNMSSLAHYECDLARKNSYIQTLLAVWTARRGSANTP
ncbi:hypothetical protein PGT21_020087 [Puccinia graminis f. sp. tritici]|uniref:Uncharacterized protein n=1 Tax=Puccinia graminis f. sp. tritici TaxID=56615 RepID=A0A5B0RFU7_PUCGR|nr:hypothetical protein PGT21_020087 [Puccinia graminis f. sp. tritici]KAA1124587.1 hypothetical protein PGTUg99_019128 [Puccinia graminis f. sp. tritici]